MMEYLQYVGLGLTAVLSVANPLTSVTLLLSLSSAIPSFSWLSVSANKRM
jgi:small neutral amino acid transporter SnatA (MarC family)